MKLDQAQRLKALEQEKASHIEENFDVSVLPDDAIEEITDGISTRIRLNSVVDTGIPGFILRGR